MFFWKERMPNPAYIQYVDEHFLCVLIKNKLFSTIVQVGFFKYTWYIFTWTAFPIYLYLNCVPNISFPELCARYIFTWTVYPIYLYLNCIPDISLPELTSRYIFTWTVCPIYIYLNCIPDISLPELYTQYIFTWTAFPIYLYLNCKPNISLPELCTWYIFTWTVCPIYLYLNCVPDISLLATFSFGGKWFWSNWFSTPRYMEGGGWCTVRVENILHPHC